MWQDGNEKDSVAATRGAGRRKKGGKVGEGNRGKLGWIVSIKSVYLITHKMEIHQHILE